MIAATSRRRWWALLLVPLLVFVSLLLLSETLYQRAIAQAPAFPFSACHKVWAHRGHAETGRENSLQSVKGAFERGAVGVELDILFDRELNDFLVSHDRPYALFDGNPLKLESVLSQYSASGFFWLDAKDLRKLSPPTAYKAAQRLSTIIQRHQLAERALVESSDPLSLHWLARQGVYTSLAVSPNDQKYSATVYKLNTALMKLAYAFAGAGAISMNAARYTPVTAATFGQVAVLLSTVNDPKALKLLSGIAEVKVILSDDDQYAITACTDRSGQ
ncbi:glycerophosphodiester phosphodiesterase [Variovorax saccharolyticus]|uniref:glycerophosphodiester phosphodiesterase n=1 Tax=Variovorax saccharolyticus TaxID=3053516 RepID=UPI002578DE3D|nr:glycerophosphodiester phosphodiesterase [Variovorax sp. J22R187]MDM0022092.1 glycerophosphodiester phosphodiesterase [Variovorax sp. J22R187]